MDRRNYIRYKSHVVIDALQGTTLLGISRISLISSAYGGIVQLTNTITIVFEFH